MQKIHIGFIGAGGIAKSHVYSLKVLKFYYDNVPELILESVTSARKESRDKFAEKFGFSASEDMEQFRNNKKIEAVFILGPNNVHYEHMKIALQMPNVRYIYLEKPVCASFDEEEKIKGLASESGDKVKIQVGFQYLQTSSVREALKLWRSGILGKPVHFDLKYYHGDYLQSEYRKKRTNRLTPAPDGGAMADLGSHAISLLAAFIGDNLKITSALQAGSFTDVPESSDLFSSISLVETGTKAAGTLSASRISSGSGDLVSIEIYSENGWLSYSSRNPEYFEYFTEDSGQQIKKFTGSNYKPVTSFPSGHVSPGWLRSLVHAHYIFFTGNDSDAFIPDLNHGLAVQRIVRETAEHLSLFRKMAENG